MGNKSEDIELFQILLNESPDAIFLINTSDYAIEYCNNSAVAMFEFENEDEFKGKFGHKYHKEPFTDEDIATVQESLNKSNYWEAEYEYISQKGNIFWGAFVTKRVTVGDKLYQIIRISDITERKLNKLKADKNQYYLEQSLEALPAIVYMIDSSYKILFASSSFKSYYEATSGKPLKNDAKITDVIVEEKIPKRIALFKKAFAGKQYKISEDHVVGDKIESYEIHFIPIRSRGGEVENILIFNFDVSDFKSQKYKLEESERKYRLLAEHSSDVIYLLDKNLNFIYFSPSVKQVLGYDPEEILKLKMADILTAESYENVIETHKKKRAENEIIKTQLQYIQKSGKTIWGENHASIIKDRNGLASAYLVITRDVTKEKEKEKSLNDLNNKLLTLNADLIKSNEELDRFVYRVSHDLKSPLNSMQGLLSIIENEKNKESREHFFSLMNKSIIKLKDFIKEISELSRNARQQINAETISLYSFLQDLIESQQFAEEAKDINFIIDVNQSKPFYSDKTRPSIVLNNLISNAIRYRKTYNDENQIKISAKVGEKQVKIEVYDNGQGIMKEHLGKIFDMFYRANQHISGTGLGLYIVKEIVDKLDGKISVSSESGVFTKFIIRLKNLSET